MSAPQLVFYHAAVSLTHPGPRPLLSTGIIKGSPSFPYKVFPRGGNGLSCASNNESCVSTESTPHIPLICKLSPVLAWAGVLKNLESFWTSPKETILWDSVCRTWLSAHDEAPLVPRYHSSIWWDHRAKRKSKESSKERQDLWILHRSRREWEAWRVSAYSSLSPLHVCSIYVEETHLCEGFSKPQTPLILWVLQKSRQVASCVWNIAPRISRAAF